MSGNKPRRLSLVDLGVALQDDLQDRLRTVVPSNVVAYNPATQSASIQPAPQSRTAAGEAVGLAQIPDAPIAFPAGGGFTISWALLPGDTVLVLCSDRGIDRWRETGTPFLPDDGRKHRIADAFVYPGAGPAPNPATGLSATDLVITGPGGISIRVTPAGTIALAEPGLPVARVGDLVAAGSTMATWIAALTTYVNGVAPGTLVPPTDFGAISSGSPKVSSG